MQVFHVDQVRRSDHANPVTALPYQANASSRQGSGGHSTLNVARFDLVTFYLVVLCAELGSLCEAAKVAHLSKSAASHRITTLEGHLGKKLFLRHHNGLQLTDAGVLCVERGRKILEEVRGLKHRIASMQAPSSKLALVKVTRNRANPLEDEH